MNILEYLVTVNVSDNGTTISLVLYDRMSLNWYQENFNYKVKLKGSKSENYLLEEKLEHSILSTVYII